MMRTMILLALLTAAACGSVADPVTGCATETVCARTCDVGEGDWLGWCAARCGACDPRDIERLSMTTDEGAACRLVEVPVAEARQATCWIPREPWAMPAPR
jgi:hypothetical protein